MRIVLGIVVVVGLLGAAATVGPPGQTYRRSSAFAACVEGSWPAMDEQSFETVQQCHDLHCVDRDLHSLEAMGHFVYTRVATGASCDEPIELRDIIE